MRPTLAIALFLIGACATAEAPPPLAKPKPAPPEKEAHPAVSAARTGIEACDTLVRRIATAWNADQRTRVGAAFANAAPSFGAAAADRLGAPLDSFALAWAQSSAHACRMHLGDGTLTKTEYGRRQACYDDALSGLSDLMTWLTRADVEVAARATDGLWEVELQLETCEMPPILEGYAPDERAQVVRNALASARVALALGKPAEAANALGRAEARAARMELFRPMLLELRGRTLLAQHQYEDAQAVLSTALELYRDRADPIGLADTYGTLAQLLSRTRRHEEAVWHAREALGAARNVYPFNSRHVVVRLLELAQVERRAGRAGRGLEAARSALDQLTQTHGSRHPMVGEALAAVAALALDAGQAPMALDTLQQAVDLEVAILGDAHPRVADSLALAAEIRMAMKDDEKALALYRTAAKVHADAFGLGHPRVADDLAGAGEAARHLGRRAEAARDFEQALDIRRQLSDAPSPGLARALKEAALALIELGKPPPRAREYIERAQQIDENLFGPDHAQVALDIHLLGRFHAARGDHETAYDLHLQARERLNDLFGPEDPRVKQADGLVQREAAALAARK